jgi:hypothetical protein
MTIAINVLLVLLGAIVAIVAAFGDTHNPNASHLQRLNTRGWIIVISVFLALVLGVAKEYSADHDQAEQRQLLFASREADHQLLASLLQSQSFPNGASASAKANEYQSLLNQREQLLQAAQKELYGITRSGRPGAGPVYQQLQNQFTTSISGSKNTTREWRRGDDKTKDYGARRWTGVHGVHWFSRSRRARKKGPVSINAKFRNLR